MKHTTLVLFALVIIGAVIFAAGCISPASETPKGTWVLIGSGPDNTPITGIITLDIADSNISGNSGVNNYFGSITVSSDGKSIISDLGSTKMAGTEEEMQAESAFFSALKGSAGYSIVDSNLIITGTDGKKLLVFVRE